MRYSRLSVIWGDSILNLLFGNLSKWLLLACKLSTFIIISKMNFSTTKWEYLLRKFTQILERNPIHTFAELFSFSCWYSRIDVKVLLFSWKSFRKSYKTDFVTNLFDEKFKLVLSDGFLHNKKSTVSHTHILIRKWISPSPFKKIVSSKNRWYEFYHR